MIIIDPHINPSLDKMMNHATAKPDLIPAQRRTLILELIRQSGVITVQELHDATGASFATIRRDLAKLDRAGVIERSHGGAALKTAPGTTFEPDYLVASRLARKEKAAIGKLAAQRLQDGQSVIFDSSSTVYEAAYQVVERGMGLTAVTNDIRIAELLAGSASINLLVSGGRLRPGSYTLLGEPGTSFLRGLHVDVVFVGIHAITGTTCCDTSPEVAFMKRYMAESAERVILLADAGKFGQVAFCDAFTLENVSEVITDDRLDPVVARRLEDMGIEVSIAAVTDSCTPAKTEGSVS